MKASEVDIIAKVTAAAMKSALAEVTRVQQLLVDELNDVRRQLVAREVQVAELVDRLAVVEAALLTATARTDEAHR